MSATTAGVTTAANLDGIGPDLRAACDRWIHWRPEPGKDGKVDKIPTDPETGGNIDHTNPENHRTFDDAVAALRQGLGLGIYLNGDGIVGVDRDGCVGDDGALTDDAAATVAAFASYAEYSPSGRGIRILARGVLPPHDRKRDGNEIYDRGRFLTITGRRVPGAPATIAEAQDAIDAFHLRYIARPESGRETRRTTAGPSSLSDDAVIARAREARNGAKFVSLWGGDTRAYDGDDSAADLALLSILAFWTQDPDQLDRLFRDSALCRSKWTDRADYRQRTIANALARDQVYMPPATIVLSAFRARRAHLRVREVRHA